MIHRQLLILMLYPFFLSSTGTLFAESGEDSHFVAPEWLHDGEISSSEGYYVLRWNSDREVELEESSDPDFITAKRIYRGNDSASSISGKRNGRYYYRLRFANRPDATWSAVQVAVVRHHPLDQALILLGTGALVFLSASLFILISDRRTRGESPTIMDSQEKER